MSRSCPANAIVAFAVASVVATLTACATPRMPHFATSSAASASASTLDLAALLRDGEVSVKNRAASLERDGDRVVLRLDERPGAGVLWLPVPEFEEGIIEADLRGRDLVQRSFVGLAFGGADDEYEAVYLRPFRFRAPDPVARASSLQYMSLPQYDWKRLRAEYPGRFERALVNPPAATDWVHLRVVMDWTHVRAYVDGDDTPVLDVERIASRTRGRVGLWAGDGSEASFANVRVTRVR